MKLALETRKANVESINELLMEFKAEGELTSGQFPQDVGEKIMRLNADWKVIIWLAIALKEQPISEEIVVIETMQESESSMFEMSPDDFKLFEMSPDDFKLDGKSMFEMSPDDFKLDGKSLGRFSNAV